MDKQKNKLIIITAPSGAGKTSITKYLMQQFTQLAFSISATTRQPRDNEKDGKDYHFISEENFVQKINNNEFIEWEMVYQGQYYGTLISELENIWNQNKIPLLDIDVKGAIYVQEQNICSTLSLFIQPPSVDELKNRLLKRGTETSESLQKRLNKAAYELSFNKKFNEIIINDNLVEACKVAHNIVNTFLNV